MRVLRPLPPADEQEHLGGARIATYGERVQDFFFIRDRKNRPLTGPRLLERLRGTLLESLGGVLEEGGQA